MRVIRSPLLSTELSISIVRKAASNGIAKLDGVG